MEAADLVDDRATGKKKESRQRSLRDGFCRLGDESGLDEFSEKD